MQEPTDETKLFGKERDLIAHDGEDSMARRSKHLAASEDELTRLTQSWIYKEDTEAAIVAASFVEDRLGFATKSCFRKLPQTGDVAKQLTEAALFDGYGPLASFFAKIDIGFALGLYDQIHRFEYHLIRSIRNDFAHTLVHRF